MSGQAEDCQRRRRLFSAEEDALILQLVKSGMSYTNIGASLGRRSSSIWNRVSRLQSLSFDERMAGKAASPQPVEPATPTKPKPTRVEIGGVVVCLGGCGRRFYSPDRKRIRICIACKKSHGDQGAGFTECALRL